MIKKYILDNPEIFRYLKTSFRYPRAAGLIFAYFIALFCLYFLQYLVMGSLSEKFFQVVYTSTVGIEFIMSFYIATYLISNSFAQEKDKDTLNFLRMSTVDRKVIALGKLFGPRLLIDLLILMTLPLVLIASFFAGIPLIHLIVVNIHLIIYSVAFNTVGLFFAVSSPKVSAANTAGIGVSIVVTFLGVSLIRNAEENPFYNLFKIMDPKSTYSLSFGDFYSLTMPSFIITLIVIAYFVYWFMKSLIRKIDNEMNKPFTKKEAIIFILFLQFIIDGILWNKISFSVKELLSFLFIPNFILISFISAILTPTFDDTLTFINKKQDSVSNILDPQSKTNFLVMVLNIITVFSIAIISSKSIITSDNMSSIYSFIALSIVFSLFNLIYSNIFYLSNIFFRKNAPIMSLIIIIISLALPVPLAFLLEKGSVSELFLLNPFVVIGMFSYSKNLSSLNIIFEVVILLIFLLILMFFVYSKEEKIIKKHRL